MIKKRWHTEAQLLKAIDRAKVRALNNGKRAEAAEAELKAMLRDVADQHSIDMQHMEVERLWKYAKGIQDGLLPKLSRQLAEFRTQTMGFVSDASIPR